MGQTPARKDFDLKILSWGKLRHHDLEQILKGRSTVSHYNPPRRWYMCRRWVFQSIVQHNRVKIITKALLIYAQSLLQTLARSLVPLNLTTGQLRG